MSSDRPEEGRLRQIRKVTEVCRAITYAASLDEVLQLTVERAADLLAADKSLLMVADEAGGLVLRSSHGVDGLLAQRLAAPLDEALVPRLAGFLDAQMESFLGVPLVVGGAIKGVLAVIRPDPVAREEHDEWVLSALADQAAIALEQKHRDEIGEFREQLMGIVGHDLRNPINTVLAASELMLLRKGLDDKDAALARKIARSASLAGRLIDQVLDLTRSRLGGGIPIDPLPLDLTDVCQQIVHETELTHPDRPLRVALAGDLGGVWDRDRLYQLLENLIGNAVHHGEPRSAIDLRVHGEEDEVVIEVANRGEPIPPAMLPFIFDAFRQARVAHPSRAGGLGLGLFISQEIARSHGGAITVACSPSAGTVFRVRLPRATPTGLRTEPS